MVLTNTTETGIDWAFDIHERVRLRPDRSEIYQMAPAYSEGTIEGRRIDPIGDFKMVFIKWDSSHWTYNGQPDMWTFEEHFDKVGEKQMTDGPDKKQVATALDVLAQALGVKSEAEPTQEEVGEQRAEEVTPDKVKQFEHVFERAVEVARDSDAFVIACVRKEDAPDGSGAQFVLTPALFSNALSRESAVLLDAQLAEIVSEAHQSLAVQEIRRLLDDGQQNDEPS